MAGSGYDYHVTTLSPEGKVYQVEYAAKAIENASTIMGLVCKDGLLLGSEKLLISKLLVPGTDRRIYTIGENAGMVITGLIPDGRNIVQRARDEYSQYFENFGFKMKAQALGERIASYVHMKTLYWVSRPFGSAQIIAIYDQYTGPSLYMVEPSGQVYGYYACAIGKGRQTVKNEIEKINFKELTCREAAFHVAKILHKCHEEMKEKKFELEMSWICPESKYIHKMLPKEFQAQIEKEALAEIEKEEMEDEDQDDES